MTDNRDLAIGAFGTFSAAAFGYAAFGRTAKDAIREFSENDFKEYKNLKGAFKAAETAFNADNPLRYHFSEMGGMAVRVPYPVGSETYVVLKKSEDALNAATQALHENSVYKYFRPSRIAGRIGGVLLLITGIFVADKYWLSK